MAGSSLGSGNQNPEGQRYDDDDLVTNDYGAYQGLVANLVASPIIGWGDNSSGQLQPPALVGNVVALACGGDHNLGLKADGTLVAWGDNSYNQNTIPAAAKSVVSLAEGDSHSLALKSDGTVIAWGDNSFGQTNVPAAASNVVAVAAGSGFSLAVQANGNVVKWGGGGSLPASFTNVMLLSAKVTHVLGLRGNGTLAETGNYVPTPTNIANIIAIATGSEDSLVLLSDGTLVAWGYSEYGQTNIPPQATNVVAIAAGEDHFVALRADGVVIAWGGSMFSQNQVPPGLPSMGTIAAGSVYSLAMLGMPAERTANEGDTVTFAAGPASRLASYQWQWNGVNLAGATNFTLTLRGVLSTNSGTYRVIIHNQVGSLTGPNYSLAVMGGPLVFDGGSLQYQPEQGAFSMRLTGAAGAYPVVIYASTNVAEWTPVYTNAPTTNDIYFTDLSSA